MNRFEMLSNFRGEYLVLDVEGLNVDDDCYTWYMSVKDKVADWYNNVSSTNILYNKVSCLSFAISTVCTRMDGFFGK